MGLSAYGSSMEFKNEHRLYSMSKDLCYDDIPYVAFSEDPSEAFKFKNADEDLGKFLAANIVYPVEAIHNNVQGKVFVTFVVTTDESLKDIRILKGFYKPCDDEALRVVAATEGKWKAGVQGGKLVNVRMNVPIAYKLTR
jgi:TonB family protein